MLKRYRFQTFSVDDCRPLIDLENIQMSWWCTGYGHFNGKETAIIVCYLPENEPLEKYWDDAVDITVEDREKITYTDRFKSWRLEKEGENS